MTAIAPIFITPRVITSEVGIDTPNKFKKSKGRTSDAIILEDLLVPFEDYFKNLSELMQHKQPNPFDFLFKPGMYIVLIFWFMYISSMVFYTGRDRI